GAQRADPWRERQDLLALERAPEQGAEASMRRLAHELANEAALSDSGLAEDRDEPPASPPGLVEVSPEARQLRVAPGQPRLAAWLGGRWRCGGRAAATLGPGRWSLEQRRVEPLRLRLRVGSEFPPERIDTELVLPERRAAAALSGVRAH